MYQIDVHNSIEVIVVAKFWNYDVWTFHQRNHVFYGVSCGDGDG